MVDATHDDVNQRSRAPLCGSRPSSCECGTNQKPRPAARDRMSRHGDCGTASGGGTGPIVMRRLINHILDQKPRFAARERVFRYGDCGTVSGCRGAGPGPGAESPAEGAGRALNCSVLR